MSVTAFTCQCSSLSNVLISDVRIQPSVGDIAATDRKWTALWDTGATGSVITPSVVSALGLLPVSKAAMRSASETKVVDVYYIDLTLPSGLALPQLQVLEACPSGCDILIGMDVISRGDFAVSHYGGRTTFTFRAPSLMVFDFVNHTYLEPTIKTGPVLARNSMCACGSGKKYKKCCGRA